MTVIYVDTRLEAWARWARQLRIGLRYPEISLLYKVLRRRAKRLGSLRPELLSAKGKETRSFKPTEVGEVPAPIAEVDRVVATLDDPLKRIIQIEYLTGLDLATEHKSRIARVRTTEYRTYLKRAKRRIAMELQILAG